MLTPRFAGRVDNAGQLHLVDRHGLHRHVRSLAGEPVEVIIRKPRRERSHQQNAYYWSVVIKLTADALGYQMDEMHEAWKLRLLRREDPDHPMPTLRSTTELTPKEFSDYVENIRTIAMTEFGINVPEPGETEEAA
jgi:hypothetical protein